MIKKNNRFLFVSFLLIIFLLVSFFTSASSVIKNTTFKITGSLQEKITEKGSDFFETFSAFKNTSALKDEVKKLRIENKKLLVELSKMEEVRQENQIIRKVVDIEIKEDEKRVIANVLGKDLSGFQIIISHQENSIKVDDPVLTPEGVLIGRVIESYGTSSKVLLLASKESSFEVKVQNDDAPIGIISGNEDDLLLLDLIPQDKKIEVGDRVVTLPIEETVSRGIFIGEIVEVVRDDVENFTKAYIEQDINPRYLDYLVVITKDDK
ncbi:MAG: rod shape-determining protein MreC [Candidatus Pacebacteria bacterium]|nr:rod shape-determining protein MreC [Candidatus Paceibacterota bacterium]